LKKRAVVHPLRGLGVLCGSNALFFDSQHTQVSYSRSFYGGERDALVESHKSAAVSRCHGKQIEIGQVSTAVNPFGGKDLCISKGQRVRPEFMVAALGELSECADHFLNGKASGMLSTSDGQ
jgi:hypothetical protein